MNNPTWSLISQSAYLKNQRHWTKPHSADISRNSSAFTAGRWPPSLLNAWVAESGNHFPEQPGYPGGSLYSGTVLSKESLSNKFGLYALEHLMACRQDTSGFVLMGLIS